MQLIFETLELAYYILNNAFLEVLKEIKNAINLDQFAIDMHFFIKYSAAAEKTQTL